MQQAGARGEPVVTVIVPAFEPAAFLDQALASVREQTLEDIELIVVDDGEQPGIEELVSSLGDERARYLLDPAFAEMPDREVRLTEARRLGYEHGRGEFVSALHGDDRWEPSFLARAVAALRASAEAPMAYARVRWLDMEDGELTPPLGVAGPEGLLAPARALDRLVRRCEPSRAAVLVRRQAALAAGGPGRGWLYSVNDWQLWLRLASVQPIVFLDAALGIERIHPDPVDKSVVTLHHTQAMLRETIPTLPLPEPRRRELDRAATRAQAETELVAAWDLSRGGHRRMALAEANAALRLDRGAPLRVPQLTLAAYAGLLLPRAALDRLNALRARVRPLFRRA